MLKIIVIVVVVFVIYSAGALASYHLGKYYDDRHLEVEEIKDFDDCVNSHNPNILADPVRCVDAKGNVFFRK